MYNRASACLEVPSQAMHCLHEALIIERDSTSVTTLQGVIRSLGKDPESFDDRVALAEQAKKSGDNNGAIVELREALLIKDDAAIRARLSLLEHPVRTIPEKTAPPARRTTNSVKNKRSSPTIQSVM